MEGPVSDLLTGATDSQGAALSVTGLALAPGSAADGSLLFDAADGLGEFIPASGFVGTAVIDYTVSDTQGATATGELDVDVTYVSSEPSAGPPQSLVMTANSVLAGPLSALLGGASDPQGNPLTVTAVALAPADAADGTIALDIPDQTGSFTPTSGFTGPVTLYYTVSDGHGGSAVGELDLQVVAPTVTAGPALVAPTLDGAPETILLSAFGATDSDQDPLTITSVTLAYSTDGTVTIATDGQSLVWTPAPGLMGAVSATVTLDDGHAGVAQQSLVLVDVQPSVNAPALPDYTTQTVQGGATVVDTYSGTGVLLGVASTQVSGNEATTTDKDASGHTIGETVVQTLGGETVQSYYGPAWTLLSGTITQDNGASTVVQDFDGAWRQLGATITTDLGGGLTEVQHFDGDWNQTSATLSQVNSQGWLITQAYGADWDQVSASIVSHPSADQAITQYFDGDWNQTSASVTTIDGDTTYTQDFDSQWRITGGTDTIAEDTSTVLTRLETRNASWEVVSAVDTAPDGSDSYDVYAVTDFETLAAANDHSTTFVLSAGLVNGDTIAGLHTLNLGGAIHDVLDFEGYGPGAQLTQLDGAHYRISAATGLTETFAVTGGGVLGPGDYIIR